MGLYNELIIAPELLPDDLKDHFAGWQTRFLAYDFNVIIEITNEGEIYSHKITAKSIIPERTQIHFTGGITFYRDLNKTWYEFTILCEKGKVLKLIQVFPETGYSITL